MGRLWLYFLIYTLFILLCYFFLPIDALGGNETDEEALLQFKAKISDDPLGVMSSWNSSLHFCQWHGVICSRRHLQRVVRLDLNSKKLSGSISPYIGNLSFLRELRLFNNSFSHEIPLEISRLHRLRVLQLFSNSIGGIIPTNISACSNLVRFEIGGNKLVGKIPTEFGFLLKLEHLSIYKNNLIGSIPHSVGNLSSLQLFSFYQNNLEGAIPNAIGKLQKLVELYLDGNKLLGKIPSSLGNLKNLNILNLGRNNLQGNIPTSLAKCQKLIELVLFQNNLTGTIPLEIFSLSSLSIGLDLSQNRLIGSLSTEVGYLKNLGTLRVSGNLLSGKIPSSLGLCISLEFLAIQDNFFEGLIPSSLASLRGIQYFDLSRNNLTGEIPEFLASLKLQYLNLSFNDFKGVVPIEGVFKNESACFIMNNNKLCGGMPEFHLPECNFKDHKNKSLTLAVKLILSIASALLGLGVIIFSILFLFWLRKKRKSSTKNYLRNQLMAVFAILFLFWLRKKRKSSTQNYLRNQLMVVSYRILLKATDEFSSTNLIGVGSFGSVYKGILNPGHHIVAIKVLNLFHPGAFESFIAECEALKNIRHRNIVKVLTTCSGVDYHGNDFKALVYEFMDNGSLDEWLHPILREDPRKLNFLQRLSIAIDVACALEYLHHHCQIAIVHCDLKPSNVLLDNKLNAYIGDFGLAKLFQEATNNFSVSQTSSIGIRGSVGYVPPEYGMGAEVSTYGDVYSYGILLLEMFTGKRPTNDMFKDSLNLRNFAKDALPERMFEIIDPILLREIVEGERSVNNNQHQRLVGGYGIKECLISIMRLGITCSTELPRIRMNIYDVVVELRLIRDKLYPASINEKRCTTNALQSIGVQI